VLDICRIYRVPPHKFAEYGRATFNYLEQQQQAYIDDCLVNFAIIPLSSGRGSPSGVSAALKIDCTRHSASLICCGKVRCGGVTSFTSEKTRSSAAIASCRCFSASTASPSMISPDAGSNQSRSLTNGYTGLPQPLSSRLLLASTRAVSDVPVVEISTNVFRAVSVCWRASSRTAAISFGRPPGLPLLPLGK
jgi:hypothetical protein